MRSTHPSRFLPKGCQVPKAAPCCRGEEQAGNLHHGARVQHRLEEVCKVFRPFCRVEFCGCCLDRILTVCLVLLATLLLCCFAFLQVEACLMHLQVQCEGLLNVFFRIMMERTLDTRHSKAV
jgi:hypothetical protein